MGDKVEVISLKKGDYLVMWNDVVCELVDKKINLEEHTCTLTTIDAVKNMKVIDALFKSAESKSWEEV